MWRQKRREWPQWACPAMRAVPEVQGRPEWGCRGTAKSAFECELLAGRPPQTQRNRQLSCRCCRATRGPLKQTLPLSGWGRAACRCRGRSHAACSGSGRPPPVMERQGQGHSSRLSTIQRPQRSQGHAARSAAAACAFRAPQQRPQQHPQQLLERGRQARPKARDPVTHPQQLAWSCGTAASSSATSSGDSLTPTAPTFSSSRPMLLVPARVQE